jgi:hemerythrin superfamily protein
MEIGETRYKEFEMSVKTKTESTSISKTDVITLIKADHKKVSGLFEQYGSSKNNSEKKKLLEQIITELNLHTAAEEEMVYPTLGLGDSDGTNEAYEEHHIVELALQELMTVSTIDDYVDAKVKVLCELVKHHVKEEETKLLPELKKSGADLNEIGRAFQKDKARFQKKPPKPGAENEKAKEFKKRSA